MKASKIQDDINRLRKKIFKYLKSKALDYELHVNKDLKMYQEDQDTCSKRKFSESSHQELIDTVCDSDIVYLGDFHTFDQNARSAIRIVRQMLKREKECCLALEMIDATKQYAIDAYMNNHITELEFLEEIEYHDSWRFPWTHYQEIFDIAKENHISIYGINMSSKTLAERDQFAAGQLVNLKKIFPESILLVVYGELHIVPNKIPSLASKISEKTIQTIIHQNLDTVYWKQMKGATSHKVVKFNQNEFCIQTAPPWIKYESMVYWYENLINDPEFDIHEYIIENGKKLFGDDVQDNFLQITLEILNLVKMELQPSSAEKFNLYDHTGLEYVEEFIQKEISSKLTGYYNSLITNNYSFKIADSSTIYCSSYSINRLAYLAGAHIYNLKQEENSFSVSALLARGDSADRFCYIATESLWSHFFSKVFNPHRKCDLYLDLKAKAYETPMMETALGLIDTLNFKDFKGQRLFSIHQIAVPIGHLLGEHLYEKLIDHNEDSAQRISLPTVHKLFALVPSIESFTEIRSVILSDKRYKTRRKGLF